MLIPSIRKLPILTKKYGGFPNIFLFFAAKGLTDFGPKNRVL
jgi:hypothetical protein